ncbi:MAG: (2Fe-2S) ferredoxin domain-containing protein [Planctomycetota bacterium]
MQRDPAIHIEVCHGSACFARGAGELAEHIRARAAAAGLSARIDLRGCLCRDACTRGPLVLIDGVAHHAVDTATADRLLEDLARELDHV